MKIEVARFRESDADTVFEIQRAAFKPLYEKYRDDGSNPYTESRETVLRKYTRDGTVGYLFILNGTAVGAVRVITDGAAGRVAALCVLPGYQGRGVARQAMLEIERLHPEIERWSLDTILEEEGNCRLYEKLGYRRVGGTKVINEKTTLVYYEKNNNDPDLPG